MRDGVLLIPVRTAIGLAAAVVIAIVLVIVGLQPQAREAVARLTDPRTTADAAGLEQQRTATEHAIHRGYVKATGQLSEVRKLTLAISATQAATIEGRARADLKSIRHDALGAVGALLGLSASDLEAYVANAEAQLGESALPDERPVLLAPDLHAIVARANDLFQRSADAGTRELTKAPSTIPTPSPSPSPTARPSPTGP